jgi:hypothetical protein
MRNAAKAAHLRYAVPWEGFFHALPRGRDAMLNDVTRRFVLEYRRN